MLTEEQLTIISDQVVKAGAGALTTKEANNILQLTAINTCELYGISLIVLSARPDFVAVDNLVKNALHEGCVIDGEGKKTLPYIICEVA